MPRTTSRSKKSQIILILGDRLNPEKPRKSEPHVNFKDMSGRNRNTIYKKEVDYSVGSPKVKPDTLKNSETAKRAQSASRQRPRSSTPKASSYSESKKERWRQKGLSFESYPRRPEHLFPLQTSYTDALYTPNFAFVQKKGNTPPLSYVTMRGNRFPDQKVYGSDSFYNNDSGRGKNEKTVIFKSIAGRDRPCNNPHFRSFLDVYRDKEKKEEKSLKQESVCETQNCATFEFEQSLIDAMEFQSKLTILTKRPHSANLNYLKFPWK